MNPTVSTSNLSFIKSNGDIPFRDVPGAVNGSPFLPDIAPAEGCAFASSGSRQYQSVRFVACEF